MPVVADKNSMRSTAYRRRRAAALQSARVPEQHLDGVRRVGSLLLAGTFFGLAVLGAVLPFLPTTPFLLLTSYFLAKSSPRLNAALLRSRFFGPVLTDWQVHRGVRRGIKIKAVIVVVLTVGLSLYLTAAPLWPMLGVIALSLIGVVFVLRLPEPRECR